MRSTVTKLFKDTKEIKEKREQKDNQHTQVKCIQITISKNTKVTYNKYIFNSNNQNKQIHIYIHIYVCMQYKCACQHTES